MKSVIIKVLEAVAYSILPILFWVFLIFGFDMPYVAILTILSALIHEIGHVSAIFLTSHSLEIPRGHISGFRIERRSFLSYRNESIILAMGPIFNLAVFLITLPFGEAMYGYIKIFGLINLATAISNLLPIDGYDGYKLLVQWFTAAEHNLALRVLDVFSFLFSAVATFLSLYLIEKFGSGYWIFGVFFTLMTSKLIKYGKHDVFEE